MRRAGFRAGVAAGVVALLAAGSATAQPRPELAQDDSAAEQYAPAQRDQLFPAQQGGGISLSQATSIALRRFPGRVVRAQPAREGDRAIFEIRILGEDGRVHIVRIDAETGAFL
jgi:uncharacterized membrane protein YkoI